MRANAQRFLVLALAGAVACGCGGTKVLREARGLEETAAPVLRASDDRVAMALEAVVTRNGPGSWARDANWDEYRFQLRSLSADDTRLSRVTLVDALGVAIAPSADRGDLIDASREVEKRYAASGQLVRESVSGMWMLAGGVAALGLGYTAAASAAYGTLLGGTVASGALVAANVFAGGGLLLIGAGVARMVNNLEVSSELRKRQTELPLPLSTAGTSVTLFFPIAPLPSAIELAYASPGGEQVLRVSTRESLAHLHAPRKTERIHRQEPAFPAEARRAGLQQGHVKALLMLDEGGEVTKVHVLETSSRAFLREARESFFAYRYNPGAHGRSVEEVMHFGPQPR